MSAFIVSREHIAALVEATFRYEVPEAHDHTPTSLGQLLWDENITSVQHRYHRDAVADLPGPIDETFVYETHACTATLRRLVRKPADVFMLARCYIYQSCEHPSWEASQAYQIVNALRDSIVKRCGMTEEVFFKSPACQRAAWDI
jgi:hypothetical protein